ncbi:MAG: hypothetical protein IJS15_12390 [Victivallales bacterium]|nr:hypothetical protein [Victivallales bacterium]
MTGRIVDFLLRSASLENPRFQHSDLEEELDAKELAFLKDRGYLEDTGEIGHSIRMHGVLVPVEEITATKPHLHFLWDGGSMVEVDRARLAIQRLSFRPLAMLIRHGFDGKNNFHEHIPGLLWLCGNFGRQQREVFLARNAGTDANVTACLKGQPSRSVIFQIGVPDDNLAGLFSEQQVCLLQDILRWAKDDLIIDRAVTDARINEMLDSRPLPSRRTGKEFLNAKRKVEGLLRDMYELLLENARRAANDQPTMAIPVRRVRQRKRKMLEYRAFHDQASLAAMAKISPKMMTLVKQEWETFSRDDNHATYLLLFDFFKKQNFDADNVFGFHDRNKAALHDIGLADDY